MTAAKANNGRGAISTCRCGACLVEKPAVDSCAPNSVCEMSQHLVPSHDVTSVLHVAPSVAQELETLMPLAN